MELDVVRLDNSNWTKHIAQWMLRQHNIAKCRALTKEMVLKKASEGICTELRMTGRIGNERGRHMTIRAGKEEEEICGLRIIKKLS